MTTTTALTERAPERTQRRPDRRFALLFVLVAVAGDLLLRVGVATLIGSVFLLGLQGLIIVHRHDRFARIDWIGVGLAAGLAVCLTLRASPWVVAPAFLGSLTLTLLVSTGMLTTRTRAWLDSGAVGIIGSQHAVRWVGTTFDRFARDREQDMTSLVRSVAIVAGLASILVALLTSGDVVASALLANIDGVSIIWHGIGFIAVLALSIVAAFMAMERFGATGGDPESDVRYALEANSIVATVAVILGAWSSVQISVALGAANTILETEGLTVAAYAREGFFQLVAVAAIVLTAMHIASRVSGLPAATEGRWFRMAARLVAVEILGLIVATFIRLWLYIEEFGLSMLRLSVAWFLGWLAFFSIVVMARSIGSAPAERWSHTVSVLSLAVVVIAFAASNPEAVVVRSTLSQDTPDTAYLLELSGDAARSVVAEADPTKFGQLITAVCARDYEGGYGPVSFNLGRPDCMDTGS